VDNNACRWCGTEIVDGIDKCPSCGARVAPPRAEASPNGDGNGDGNGSGHASEPAPVAATIGTTPVWASPAAESQAPVEAMQNWAPPVQIGAPAWASPAAATSPAGSAAPAAPVSPAAPSMEAGAAVEPSPPAPADMPQPPLGPVVAPPPSWTPVATAEKTRTSPLVYVAVAVVAAIAAFGAMRMLGGDLVTFPDTVLGQSKMTGPQVDTIVATLEDTQVAGQSFRAAFYGAGTPALMIVVADASSLADPEESWKGFGGGFASTSGTTVEQKAKQTADIDGVNYICAPVTNQQSTVCQWTDERTTGYVFDYTVGDPKAAITRTQSVYEVVVAA
jgi:hypothetical protein